MKILVVGGGGREHALTWRFARDPGTRELHAAPGNAGIAGLATCHPVEAGDVAGLTALAERLAADLVVIGPEAPLVAGLADELRGAGVAVFGPSADAARLEGSKAWAKEMMRLGGIPTARAGSFSAVADAAGFVDELGGRAVIKADGLAAGKGVTVADDRETALAAIEACLIGGAFGEAGSTVLVEELLEGPEISAFALCDGETVVPLACSRDAKRLGDGDTGPNTGGMGAYSPVAGLDAHTEADIWDIVRRTVKALRTEGIAYRGLLYAGLMITADGPKVLEYNCRFGDPETQAVLPRLASDLGELLMASATGSLSGLAPSWTGEAAVTVVLASGGYPGAHETGVPISGLEAATQAGGLVFHAGTAERDGSMVTAGGRVLSVTALGAGIAEARALAYRACGEISFDGMTMRSDIAAAAAEGEEP
jgi:phosphoribosylamine--glycine ligase